jgi:stress response protein YsnF
MSRTVIGLYDDADTARKAVKALVEAGSHEQDIEVVKAGSRTDAVVSRLTEHGFDDKAGQRVAEAVQKGRTLVAAEVADESVEDADAILREQGAVRLQNVSSASQRPRTRTETETVPVVEEHIEIGKRRETSGGVRVTTQVTETPVQEKVTLREEEVEVKRRRINRPLERGEAATAFQDRTIEAVNSTERAEVRKEARVTGEVEITRTVTEHEKTVGGTERRTEVAVEKLKDGDQPSR